MPRIIKNMEARLAKLPKPVAAKKEGPNPVETLTTFLKAKNFAEIGVGEGMEFKIPAGTEPMKYLAQVRGKVIPCVREGADLAGRVYKLKVDKESNSLVLWRDPDAATPLAAKRGGRPKGSGKVAAEGIDTAQLPPPPGETANGKASEEKGEEAAPNRRGRKPKVSREEAAARAKAHLNGGGGETKVTDLTA